MTSTDKAMSSDDILEQEASEPENEVTALHDLIAGGVAGSASVVVGHPFDTVKVRLQTSSSSSTSLTSVASSFGGVGSLFRGMGAPLSCAAVVNALIFSAFGESSRVWDDWFDPNHERHESEAEMSVHCADHPDHAPWKKSFACGSFAGFAQCLVICPMEHVKCRLQVQHGKGSPDHVYRGPTQATYRIAKHHGVTGLYRGWWSTIWREVPAFGLYFSSYDWVKDWINAEIAKRDPGHTHSWMSSAIAGGMAGSLTWVVIYPMDVIKSKIQTSPLDAPRDDIRIWNVGRKILEKHGWRYMFRGLGVTLLRAFPVNGIIFPVYELTLKHVSSSDGWFGFGGGGGGGDGDGDGNGEGTGGS